MKLMMKMYIFIFLCTNIDKENSQFDELKRLINYLFMFGRYDDSKKYIARMIRYKNIYEKIAKKHSGNIYH
jgi:hypothetical protein